MFPQVHEQCVALLMQSRYNEGIRHICSMEQGGSGHSDRVCRPPLQFNTAAFDSRCSLGCQPEVLCDDIARCEETPFNRKLLLSAYVCLPMNYFSMHRIVLQVVL